jgi:hypothetical protein
MTSILAFHTTLGQFAEIKILIIIIIVITSYVTLYQHQKIKYTVLY